MTTALPILARIAVPEDLFRKLKAIHNAASEAAIATMTDHPVLIHVPVGTGASGKEPLRAFYKDIFIPQMPPDIALELLTRTVAPNRIVDEFVLHFTHTVRMDWFAPGIESLSLTIKASAETPGGKSVFRVSVRSSERHDEEQRKSKRER